ncbi:MAG TPA: ShlB/FhaC/HecB family hemolysin secretion/activation protein [Candidatus Omnitrophota bacterium]|nr:ShlB/FhaC/HecB family hemolysin secretion/activation protein [Candidatus Omnitrophota bacterium]
MFKRILCVLVVLCFGFGTASRLAFAAAETAGSIVGREQIEKNQEQIEERIKAPRQSDQGEVIEEGVEADHGPKVLIRSIVVEGATILTAQEVRAVTLQYEGQELSLKDMQKVADLITAEYRKKGYVTSRAYLPPQNIESGTLLIRIVEGTLGDLQIRGNKYFSSSLLARKIALKPQDFFDYAKLQKALSAINEHPDRKAKAVLIPGQKSGTTDVVLEVQDRLPIHAGVAYDNWGSRYVNKHRYAGILQHNNLFGQDDKLYLKYQESEAQRLQFGMARYSYPITTTVEAGGYAAYNEVRSGLEFKPLDSNGSAALYGVFLNKRMIEEDSLDLRLNFGFDSKSIEDESLGGASRTRDELRVVKSGIDVDVSDPLGRTILTTELNAGIPNFMGAMQDHDPLASRPNASADFTKGVMNLYRLQPLPWELTLLWKNTGQFTNHRLAAVEEFQIGGPTSVRGYPAAEFTGDKGYYTSFELSFPVYPLSKDIRVPFRKQDRLYDALRLVAFWDWGYVSRHQPSVGEEEHNTLRAAGFGVRLNLTEHLDFAFEVGYPLGGPVPSDEDHAHPWIEFSYIF